jgi:hypothetical protein
MRMMISVNILIRIWKFPLFDFFYISAFSILILFLGFFSSLKVYDSLSNDVMACTIIIYFLTSFVPFILLSQFMYSKILTLFPYAFTQSTKRS